MKKTIGIVLWLIIKKKTLYFLYKKIHKKTIGEHAYGTKIINELNHLLGRVTKFIKFSSLLI